MLTGILLLGQAGLAPSMADLVAGLQTWVQLAALVATGLLATSWSRATTQWGAALLGFLLGIWALGTRAHFEFFGVGLEPDTLALALDGLRSQEVHLPAGWLLPAGLTLALCVFGGFALSRWQGSLSARPLHPIASGVWILLGISAAALPLPRHGIGPAVSQMLPWMSAPAGAFSAFALREESGQTLRITLAEMEAQALRLRDDREELLRGITIRRPADIVWIVLESFRADLVQPQITPFLSALGDRCLHPASHYSSGANTSSGLFGMLHGLSLLHYPAFVANEQTPIPLEVLGRLGYERRLHAGFDLDYAGLDRMYFRDAFDHRFVEPPGTPAATDALLSQRLLEQQDEGGPPTFDFLFLYSTHWGYDYPPEFEKFTPVAPPDLRLGHAARDGALHRWAEGLKNRQRNAAAYLDHLLEPLVAPLLGRQDPPLVVITGDHGEEFFERGRLGHTWGVNEEMVRVPLWICLPGAEPSAYRYSDHRDIFPTLFEALGISLDTGRAMTGKSLLAYDPSRDVALTAVPRRRARFRMAAIGDEMKIEFLPFAGLTPTRVSHQNDDPWVPLPAPERVRTVFRNATDSRHVLRAETRR